MYGYGPVFKVLSLAFLSFMVVFKHYNVPVLFFILYGLGSLFFVSHLLAIKKHNSSLVDAGIYAQYINVVLCAITIFVIVNKTNMMY